MYALCLLACLPAAAPPIDGRIADFTLLDAKGRAHRLSDWREAKAVVVVFLAVDCPLAKLYAPRLKQLDERYSAQGVKFVAIAPGRQDNAAIGRYVRQHSFPFPILRDTGSVIADRFGAERSPEAFILDEARR